MIELEAAIDGCAWSWCASTGHIDGRRVWGRVKRDKITGGGQARQSAARHGGNRRFCR